jgi:arginyl-tRNA synthetase
MVKSNGTVKYEATDLATIYNRTIEFKPDRIFYVIDKRQEMQMFLVFNAAESTGIYKQDKCEFLGFGTINGDDGLPLKTRAGGAATALGIIEEVETAAAVSFENNKKNLSLTEEEKKDIIYKISLASLKFADLANFRENDYIFTPDKFVKFEGKTGCYVLYTAVRMNSILEKNSIKENSKIIISNEFEKNIVLKMLEYSDIIDQA